jgi:hypothetical protein
VLEPGVELVPEPGVEPVPESGVELVPEPGVEPVPEPGEVNVPEPGVEDGQHDTGLEAEGEVGVCHHVSTPHKSSSSNHNVNTVEIIFKPYS